MKTPRVVGSALRTRVDQHGRGFVRQRYTTAAGGSAAAVRFHSVRGLDQTNPRRRARCRGFRLPVWDAPPRATSAVRDSARVGVGERAAELRGRVVGGGRRTRCAARRGSRRVGLQEYVWPSGRWRRARRARPQASGHPNDGLLNPARGGSYQLQELTVHSAPEPAPVILRPTTPVLRHERSVAGRRIYSLVGAKSRRYRVPTL
jgi:hypothetical protein